MKDKQLRKALKKAGIIKNEKYPEIGIEVKEFVDELLKPYEQFLEMEYGKVLVALCDYLNITIKKEGNKYVVIENNKKHGDTSATTSM